MEEDFSFIILCDKHSTQNGISIGNRFECGELQLIEKCITLSDYIAAMCLCHTFVHFCWFVFRFFFAVSKTSPS